MLMQHVSMPAFAILLLMVVQLKVYLAAEANPVNVTYSRSDQVISLRSVDSTDKSHIGNGRQDRRKRDWDSSFERRRAKMREDFERSKAEMDAEFERSKAESDAESKKSDAEWDADSEKRKAEFERERDEILAKFGSSAESKISTTTYIIMAVCTLGSILCSDCITLIYYCNRRDGGSRFGGGGSNFGHKGSAFGPSAIGPSDSGIDDSGFGHNGSSF